MRFEWTDAAIATLRQLAPTHTSGEIAERLGADVSRSAVLGKAKRLGISLSKSNSDPDGATPRRTVGYDYNKPRLPQTRGAKLQEMKAARVATRSPVVFAARPSARAPIMNPSPAQLSAVRAEIAIEGRSLDRTGVSDHSVRFIETRLGQCRYPLWSGVPDIAAAMVCGAPTASAKCSWCARHLTAVTATPVAAARLAAKGEALA